MQMNLGNDEKLGIMKVDEGRRGSIWMNAYKSEGMTNDYDLKEIRGSAGTTREDVGRSGGMQMNLGK